MSIDKQRKLQYIPIVHIIIPFCLSKMGMTHKTPFRWFVKFSITMIVAMCIPGVLMFLITEFLGDKSYYFILNNICIYLFFLMFAKVSIKGQIGLEANGKKEKTLR